MMDIYQKDPWEDKLQGPYQLISTLTNGRATYFVVLDIASGRFSTIDLHEARYVTPLARAMSEDE